MPEGDDWTYEIKWDGYRAIAEVTSDDVVLYSRNGISFVELYPEIVDDLRDLQAMSQADTEMVAVGGDEDLGLLGVALDFGLTHFGG